MTIDDFFAGQADSRLLFEAVRKAVESIGPADVRVTKSQVAFRRRVGFAFVWMPQMYLHRGDASPRWKEVVEPYPGRFTHHLELHSVGEIDDEVNGWLKGAWEEAG